jgi:hypothetical protein
LRKVAQAHVGLQNSEQNTIIIIIIITNKLFEYMINFKYLGETLKNEKCINEDIKSRLNSSNV